MERYNCDSKMSVSCIPDLMTCYSFSMVIMPNVTLQIPQGQEQVKVSVVCFWTPHSEGRHRWAVESSGWMLEADGYPQGKKDLNLELPHHNNLAWEKTRCKLHKKIGLYTYSMLICLIEHTPGETKATKYCKKSTKVNYSKNNKPCRKANTASII